MSTHTPGPWNFRRVNNVDHYRCVPTDAQDRELLKAVPIDRIAEVEANARLIAAAPELLEALKNLLGEADTDAIDEETRLMVEAAHAAIAKAEWRG